MTDQLPILSTEPEILFTMELLCGCTMQVRHQHGERSLKFDTHTCEFLRHDARPSE